MDNDKDRSRDPTIPKFIGGKKFHFNESGSLCSKSNATSSIIGYGPGQPVELPEPFMFDTRSILSSLTSTHDLEDQPNHPYATMSSLSPTRLVISPFFSRAPSAELAGTPQSPLLMSYPLLPQKINFEVSSPVGLAQLSDSSEPTIDSEYLAKSVHVKKGNSDVVLVVMSVGMKGSDKVTPIIDYSNDVIFNPKINKNVNNNKICSPPKHELLDEMKRRKRLFGDDSKTNSQRTKQYYVQWLTENPRTHPEDINYIGEKAKEMKRIFTNNCKAIGSTMIKGEEEDTKGTEPGKGRWEGQNPRVRLIECIVGVDDNRKAFMLSKTALTKKELDGRNNKETARPDVWTLVADKWNDDKFNPICSTYPSLHPHFKTPMDISFNSVKDMGACTPQKAKDKFQVLRTQMSQVKTRWERSGNGTCAKKQPEYVINLDTSDDDDFAFIPGGDNRSDFLGKYKSAILYLWKRAEETDFLKEVCQQISEDARLDGTSAMSIVRTPSKRKHEKEEKARKEDMLVRSELMHAMAENNKNVKSVAVLLIRKELLEVKLKRKELQRAELLDEETDSMLLQHIDALSLELDEKDTHHQQNKKRSSVQKKRKLEGVEEEPIDLSGDSKMDGGEGDQEDP